MKDGELIGKVHNSVYQQCRKRGYAAPVDVLMDVGILQKQKYEEWRFGKIPYLEAVCNCNLRQLSFLMKQIRCYADKTGFKPSFCYYKRWGTKKEKRTGAQAGISAAVQQKWKSRNRKGVCDTFS